MVLNAIQAAIEAFDADAADNVGGTETTGPQHVAFHTDVAAEASAVGPQPLTGQLDVSAETSVADPQPADSLGQRRADAWVRLAEAALGSELIPPTAAERYQTVVHIPQTLPGQHLDTACSLDNGQSIAAETAKRLACDASVITITEDTHGNPLHIGRKTRSISPALRRALQHRDGGCRFPGCTHTRFVDAHHVKHWSDGGETDIGNLVTLCSRHHRLVHEGGFGLEVGAGGKLNFTRPAGESLHLNQLPRFRGDADYLIEANAALGLAIDHETCEPAWDGYGMDYGIAVYGLLDADGLAW